MILKDDIKTLISYQGTTPSTLLEQKSELVNNANCPGSVFNNDCIGKPENIRKNH